MKRNDILSILIPLFIFVVAWIGFSVYHNIASSTISEVLNIQIAPISPDFDNTTFNNLKKRQNVIPVYQLEASSETSNESVPISETPKVSSDSARNQASGGALLQ